MTVSETIKTAFDQYFEVPLEVWDVFVARGEAIETVKDQILKRQDETEQYLYFILQGAGGIFLWNNNNYICTDLCYKNEFFGDYMSFLNGQASRLEVMVFEDTDLFRISKSQFLELGYNPLGDKISRFASEALFMHKQQQQIDILTKTAKERYIELQSKQPDMLQCTPQKHIASYLGITAQSLSRIRSELTKH